MKAKTKLILSIMLFVVLMSIFMILAHLQYDIILLFIGPVSAISIALIALAYHAYEYENKEEN